MIRFFKELYLAEFTFFYRASSKSWSHGYNVGKGVAAVSLFASLILLGIGMWVAILTGKQSLLVFERWKVGIAFSAFFSLNYYILAIRGYGIRFEREFDHLKKTKRTFLGVCCFVVSLASAAIFIYSGYVYQHFFHIIPKSGS